MPGSLPCPVVPGVKRAGLLYAILYWIDFDDIARIDYNPLNSRNFDFTDVLDVIPEVHIPSDYIGI